MYRSGFTMLIANNNNKGRVRAATLEMVAINRRLEWQKGASHAKQWENRSQCKDQNVGMSLAKPRNLEKPDNVGSKAYGK